MAASQPGTQGQLTGKVAIVTGGGSGIGRAIVRLFAREGATVAIAEINLPAGEETAQEVRRAGGTCQAYPCDVSVSQQVRDLVEQVMALHGRIDVLVNNALFVRGNGLVDTDEETWNRNIAVTLTAPFLCAKTVLPHMLAQGGGLILNIASVNGIMAFGEIAYSAAKAGLINLTQNIAVMYGRKGIRCNAIAPGTVRTAAWDAVLERDPATLDRVAQWYPLRRVGRPEEIAACALFLASDACTFANGATFVIDGGLTAGLERWIADAGMLDI
jgi:NAD(P)-dependent dehydrogenase (short-subunit alcohol dehydrogenase family)